ncbi:mismatch repair endonuclease PMS2 [Chelonus insularis]|uniref:mismatch repair endonuclease PMS2 n=1 Tax=Chelonus insularis TaxID=460826 RepID=UPI00158B1F61|nr:mismatch repair endonuclease PMS2-like [Chelonus insularis]
MNEEDKLIEPVATSAKSKKIVAIDKKTVHQICSGQVVLDLAGAIKELVENSLDSGATQVTVKLINYGKTSITVIDNGSGVVEDDFEGLGLKHHTSKLRDFVDLQDVSTFGFRGEALSSLCALSDLTVTTKHDNNEYAYKLQFDKNGNLQKKEVCARERGTTVCVQNLFKSLPVRYKEFEKNIKREFGKAVNILNGYCLVSVGVKILCTNVLENKSNNVVVSTTGTGNVLENAVSVFGKKIIHGVENIEIVSLDEDTRREFNLSQKDEVNFTWEFYASSCEHNMGLNSSNRQFFFVNGRPCNLAKISKLINNIYHNYNNKQYPFVYLNLKLNQEAADFNVTPDKRTIFLIQEKLVLATIKISLSKKWDKMQGIFSEAGSIQFQSTLKRNFSSTNATSSTKSSPPTKRKLMDLEFFEDMERNDSQIFSSSKIHRNKSKLYLPEKIPDSEMKISIESIRKAIESKLKLQKEKKNIKYQVKFKVDLEMANNTSAEEELNKHLTRESFLKMVPIGQFNLGFIIARLEGDLFLIDQHASDEKFQFEKLNNQTKLKTQKLVAPKLLNLTALNESIAIENKDLLEANGFSIKFNEDGESGKRLQLVEIPVSGNWQFGQTDIEELLFLIKEGDSDGIKNQVLNKKILRPSRVRDMLASRACRSAVMIGTALNHSEMYRIITQMSQISRPWNCPHGRPTMRHLLSLKYIMDE